MIMQVVIDKTSKLVKRYGYCDIEHDGNFDSDTEEIVEKNFDFIPDVNNQDWYWHPESETFTMEP